jgi:hypothetical protein
MTSILFNKYTHFIYGSFEELIKSAFGDEPIDITIEYLRKKLTNIAIILDNYNTKIDFIHWVNNNLDISLHTDIKRKINDDLNNNRMLCILFLLYNINIIYQKHIEIYRRDTLLLPWDIKYSIKKDKKLSKIFKVKYNKNIVFDDIVIKIKIILNDDDDIYIDKYNKEFTCGLLLINFLYKSKYIIKYNNTIFTQEYYYRQINNIKFNFPENEDLMKKLNINIKDLHKNIIEPIFEYTNCIFNMIDIGNMYEITLNNRQYSFNTLTFIRGLCTGLLWNNIDYHFLNDNIIQHYDNSRKRINENIVFTL